MTDTQTTPTPTYIETIAKIESTFLGFEDHGIFTFVLQLNYGHSGQGAGMYDLRVADCSALLQGVLRACGVDSWENVKGRTVLALTEGSGGMVVGIAPLPTEQGERFIFSHVFES